ncbi:MAG: hypothetical protein GF364_00265 [Candidatus Lokiarchaeota archaeon]|nr:hypothetical protein [Candidatus Lokiarchaeota archaeon]
MNNKQILSSIVLLSIISLGIYGSIFSDDIILNDNSSTVNGPLSSDIDENGVFSDSGSSLVSVEYAQGSNDSQDIPAFDSGGSSNGYINTPPLWTGYKLFANITELTDEAAWEDDGEINNGYTYWTYSENDYDDDTNPLTNGSNTNEDAWGYIADSGETPSGSEGNSLFVHQGFLAPDFFRSAYYSSFQQSVYVDRKDVTEAKLSFWYWTDHSGHGISHFFAKINGYKRPYYIFEPLQPNNTWTYAEFSIPIAEVSNYITAPGTVDIEIGIQCTLNNLGADSSDGYINSNAYIDNVTLSLKGKAYPSQVELNMSDEIVDDGDDYGTGNLTITGSWYNPSATSYSPTVITFETGNSTNVEMVLDLDQYTTRTKSTQDSDGNPNTEFFTEHGAGVNWTVYYYGLVPDGYEDYNFTITYPSDWDIWAAYDPTPDEILTSLSVGSGNVGVGTTAASKNSGIWRFEFNSTNYVNDIKIYRNTTIDPSGAASDWTETSEFYAGDYLNVTAYIKNDGIVTNLVDTQATLTIKLPDGTIWDEVISYASVTNQGEGIANFSRIYLPTSGANYQVGDYEIFVTWNNSYSSFGLNETGVYKASCSLYHYSKLDPEQSLFTNFVEGSVANLRIDFQDNGNGDAIRGATCYFDNLTGQTQSMDEISPGRYYAQVKAPNINPGVNTITVYANHSLYKNITVDITFEVYIKTDLEAEEYPDISQVWGENVTINLNYRELTSEDGIESATIVNDWIGDNFITDLTGGSYLLELNTSTCSPGDIYQITISTNDFGYVVSSLIINIEITQRNSQYTLYLEGQDKTAEKSVSLLYQEILDIDIDYYDSLNTSTIIPAQVVLQGVGAGDISIDYDTGLYRVDLDTTLLGVGVHSLVIKANSTFNNPKTILISVTVQSRTTDYSLFLNTFDRTLSKKIDVYALTKLNITVDYFDLGSGITINPATLRLQGAVPSDLYLSYENGLYNYSLNMDVLGIGTHSLTIVANASNYDQLSFQFEVTVKTRPTDYELYLDTEDKTLEKSISKPYQTTLDVAVDFFDANTSQILGANIVLQGVPGGDITLSYSGGYYQNTFDTGLLGIGIHELTISCSRSKFVPKNFLLTLIVTERPTDYVLYLNETNKNVTKTINAPLQTSVNVSVDFRDIFGGFASIPGATVLLKTQGAEDVTMNLDNGLYQHILDTTSYSLGIKYFTIVLSKVNYTQRSLQFSINLEKRQTGLTLYLDEEDKTLTKTLAAPLRKIVNISIRYYDYLKSSTLGSADVRLVGFSEDPLEMDFINGVYQILVNTSDLGLDEHYITVSAVGSIHKQNSILITLDVTKIPTEISTSEGEDTLDFSIKDNTITLQVSVVDTLFDKPIYGAEVSYSSSFGSGILSDEDNDGNYTVTIKNPGVGVYSIQINVYKGNEYSFKLYTITVNVIDDTENVPDYTLYILIGIIIALIVGLGLYQTIYRYPKVIRKLHKIDSSIKKKQPTKVTIKSMSDAIFDEYKKVVKPELPKLPLVKIEPKVERDISEIEEKAEKKEVPEVAEKVTEKPKKLEKIEKKEKAEKAAKKRVSKAEMKEKEKPTKKEKRERSILEDVKKAEKEQKKKEFKPKDKKFQAKPKVMALPTAKPKKASKKDSKKKKSKKTSSKKKSKKTTEEKSKKNSSKKTQKSSKKPSKKKSAKKSSKKKSTKK